MAEAADGALGRGGFARRHGLGDARAAAEVVQRVQAERLDVVRVSFPDQHGILRGKTLVADTLASAFENGVSMVTTLLAKDTAHRTVFPWFTEGGGFDMGEMTGAGDFLMLPAPASFRVLPWAPGTGWMLADIYFPAGDPVPFATREILRSALGDLARAGYDYVCGLEVEFHLFRLEDAKLDPQQAGQPGDPPAVSLLAHGFQYLTEQRMDELDPFLEPLRRDLLALGLPLRTLEVEYGPSQVEITLKPSVGMATADDMVLLRSAVKQIARRHGLHASFMCRPNLANLFSSGWHLHQSLRDSESGENRFMPADGTAPLSPLGRHFAAGLLEHASAGAIFAAPTLNGYKRYQPHSLAPDRVHWSRDNRGALLRVLGGPGDPGTRIENRAGEPAANPYLYLASQVLAGLDGIERAATPPPMAAEPYDDEAPRLPGSLLEAVAALRSDDFFRARLGDRFIDYYLHIKQAEIDRFLASVTDWEQREYFEIF